MAIRAPDGANKAILQQDNNTKVLCTTSQLLIHQVNPGPVGVESRRINSIIEGNSRPLMVTHIVLSTAASYQQPDDDRLTRRD